MRPYLLSRVFRLRQRPSAIVARLASELTDGEVYLSFVIAGSPVTAGAVGLATYTVALAEPLVLKSAESYQDGPRRSLLVD